MYRFETVKKILSDMVGGSASRAHESFWKDDFSRDQFINYVIPLGLDEYPLLIVGDGENSNLIKALLGKSPFGVDLPDPPNNAKFRRMPPSGSEVLYDSIDYIKHWIDDGCPLEILSNLSVDIDTTNIIDPQYHNNYWRDFDVWSLFHRPPSLKSSIITCYTRIGVAWVSYALDDSITYERWSQFVRSPQYTSLIESCSEAQLDTIAQFYGAPIRQNDLFESFELFGKKALPADKLRPTSPSRGAQGAGNHEHSPEFHAMNGEDEWFIWFGVAATCLELEIEIDAWLAVSKAILVGVINDGVYRERFVINDFSSDDPATPEQIRTLVEGLDIIEVTDLAIRLRKESGIPQRT